MTIVDADSHLVETPATWDHMDTSELWARPQVLDPHSDPEQQYWFAGGSLRSRKPPDSLPGLPDLNRVDARIDRLDELGVSVQVLYPTMFLEQVADRPESEIPICRAYHQWAAAIARRSGGRLRWVAPLPLLSMPETLEHMAFAKENGACGVLLRPIEGEFQLHDHHFDPLYERALGLGMPICVHSGNGNPRMNHLLGQYDAGASFRQHKLSLAGSFHGYLIGDMQQRFPGLRTGFFGAGAQLMAYPLLEWSRRLRLDSPERTGSPLERRNLWVCLVAHDDIPYLIRKMGDTRLLIGTEFGHTHRTTAIQGLQRLQETGAVTQESLQRIASDNARAFYGI